MYFADGLSDKNKILSTMRRHVKRKGVKAIFLDYLQLVKGMDGSTRNEQVSDLTRSLKMFASEYSVPVVALSQLNRANEKIDREPILSDLRDSGSIEQDADAVVFLHEKDGIYYLIQAKNRKVGSKKIEINFEKKYTRFGGSRYTVPPFERNDKMDWVNN
jgi:replicative DNA helicase